jgi:hypothetical protein
MPFPLTLDPDFRKEIVRSWLDDVDDRIEMNQLKDAEYSWQTANKIYLSLPFGSGDMDLESQIIAARVKIDKRHQATNENNL